MPLVKCPDCFGTVSDAAPACLSCGRPLSAGGFDPVETVAPEDRPHPWLRLWARGLDVGLAVIIGGFVLLLFAPHTMSEGANPWFPALFSLFLWNFIEAGLLSLWATTPGKSLFNIRVRREDGGKLTYLQALRRAFHVWWRGLALGIPIVNVVTMLIERRRLLKDGETAWDEKGTSRVDHGKVNVPGVVVTLLLLAAVVYVLLILMSIPVANPPRSGY